MKSFIKLTVVGATLVACLTGCANMRKVLSPEDENSLSGVGSILRSGEGAGERGAEGYEQLSIDKLLVDYKLNALDTISGDTSNTKYQYLRNEMQERIIAASNQRCMAYVKMLLSSKSQAQTGWTSLSLLLSGAASVVPGVQAAKVLAAGSTASTGILSTYTEAYFNNITIGVISAGITKKRQLILQEITNSQKSNLIDYPINAAISDALNYHSACNIIAGLEVAQQAVAGAADKDLAAMRQVKK
ncbi:hypothetical protein ACQUJO_12335 [Ralstonia pseudosolanacearum]